MDNIVFLPIGSIVIVKGGVKKSMIIARGLATVINGETKYFDYGACLYPEGLMGDSVMYFNHADIAKVVFKGFTDDDDVMMVENINEWLEKTPLKRGNPYQLNQQNTTAVKNEEG
ncbi:MAG: DUF4176 domain-containing protein [Oscillospiraceae bacterium]